MTNNTNIEGLPPLPDGYDGYRYGAPQIGDLCHLHGLWRLITDTLVFEHLIATRTPLWYPESWRDDMDNVFEVEAGQWPPCAMGDVIEVVHKNERKDKVYKKHTSRSTDFNWADGNIVAIRIIERAKPCRTEKD